MITTAARMAAPPDFLHLMPCTVGKWLRGAGWQPAVLCTVHHHAPDNTQNAPSSEGLVDVGMTLYRYSSVFTSHNLHRGGKPATAATRGIATTSRQCCWWAAVHSRLVSGTCATFMRDARHPQGPSWFRAQAHQSVAAQTTASFSTPYWFEGPSCCAVSGSGAGIHRHPYLKRTWRCTARCLAPCYHSVKLHKAVGFCCRSGGVQPLMHVPRWWSTMCLASHVCLSRCMQMVSEQLLSIMQVTIWYHNMM